jgi:hypothetical protein
VVSNPVTSTSALLDRELKGCREVRKRRIMLKLINQGLVMTQLESGEARELTLI